MNLTALERAVQAGAARFALRYAAAPEQRALFRTAFLVARRHRRHVGRAPFSLGIRLPLLVHAAVRGDGAAAVPLASAVMFLFTGMDLLDDLMDEEVNAPWRRHPPAESLLAGATLVSTLPQLLLCTLDAPPATIVALQRTLAASGLAISAGQQRDLILARSGAPAPDVVLASVRGKSGEPLAMVAAMAALLAGADEERTRRFAAMGRALGTAAQLASDCADLLAEGDGRALTAVSHTLPVALFLQAAAEPERRSLLDALAAGTSDGGLQRRARALLRDAGVFRECAMLIALLCAEAHTALVQAEALEPAAGGLRDLIDRCRLVPADG